MNSENTRKLVEEFPELYWQIALPMDKTAMCWGFECGDGWFDLLYRLSTEIKPLVEELNKTTDPEYRFAVVQVKEKFGTLRYYTNFGSDEIYGLISKYEGESAITCETCGKPGELRSGGWLYTACDEHTQKESRWNDSE